MFGSEYIVSAVSNHPQEILIWTNGFFCALALRRGRIEAVLGKVVPVDDKKDKNE